MNYVDFIIIAVLLFAFFKGFKKGFVIEIASLAALVLGVIGAIYFSDQVAVWLKAETDMSKEYIHMAAFGLTFIGILILVQLVGKLVDSAVKAVALGPLNRIMGGVFGLARALLVMSVFFYFLDFVDHKTSFLPGKTIKQSKLYYPVEGISEKLIPMLTDSNWYKTSGIDELIDDAGKTFDETFD